MTLNGMKIIIIEPPLMKRRNIKERLKKNFFKAWDVEKHPCSDRLKSNGFIITHNVVYMKQSQYKILSEYYSKNNTL